MFCVSYIVTCFSFIFSLVFLYCFLTLYLHYLYYLFISTFFLSINHLCHLYLSFISVHVSCLCASHTTQGVFILSPLLREKAILYFQIPPKSTRWCWSKVTGWLLSGPAASASFKPNSRQVLLAGGPWYLCMGMSSVLLCPGPWLGDKVLYQLDHICSQLGCRGAWCEADARFSV